MGPDSNWTPCPLERCLATPLFSRLDFGLGESAADGGDCGAPRRRQGGARGWSDGDRPAVRVRRPAAAAATTSTVVQLLHVPAAGRGRRRVTGNQAGPDEDDDGVEQEGGGDQTTQHVVDAPKQRLHARTQ